MRKKHFVSIARVLRETRPDSSLPVMLAQWEQDVHALAQLFSDFNDTFDYDRFVEACGVEVFWCHACGREETECSEDPCKQVLADREA